MSLIETKDTRDSALSLLEKREKCRKDPFFLAEMLGYDFQRDVHTELFAQFPPLDGAKDIRDLDKIKNVLVLWPRGTFKTSATCLYIVQIILNFPDVRILLMSGTQGMTKKWLQEIKSHFNHKNGKSQLPDIFPEYCKENLGNATAFVSPARVRTALKDPTVAAASQKVVATGSHWDFLFGDDMVHTGNYRNIELLDKLEEDFSNFIPLLDPGCYTIVTGTRYTPVDNYGRIIKRNRGEWRVSEKASYDGNGKMLFAQRRLADGRQVGITREMLDQIEHDDPVMFNAQYMNRIFATGRQTFPQELILGSVRSSKLDAYPKDFTCYFAVDLAESKKAESDHSVIAIGRRDANGAMWIEDVVGSNWTPAQLANTLLNLVILKRPARVFIEKSPGATFFVEYIQVLAREHGVHIYVELVPLSNQRDAKYMRISALESAFRNKRLFLSAGIRDFDRLEEEFTQFPKGRHDDRPDAIATLYNHLNMIAPVLPQNRFVTGGFVGIPGEDEQPNEGSMLGFGFTC